MRGHGVILVRNPGLQFIIVGGVTEAEALMRELVPSFLQSGAGTNECLFICSSALQDPLPRDYHHSQWLGWAFLRQFI